MGNISISKKQKSSNFTQKKYIHNYTCIMYTQYNTRLICFAKYVTYVNVIFIAQLNVITLVWTAKVKDKEYILNYLVNFVLYLFFFLFFFVLYFCALCRKRTVRRCHKQKVTVNISEYRVRQYKAPCFYFNRDLRLKNEKVLFSFIDKHMVYVIDYNWFVTMYWLAMHKIRS